MSGSIQRHNEQIVIVWDVCIIIGNPFWKNKAEESYDVQKAPINNFIP